MSESPPLSDYRQQADDDQLNLLSLFHFVGAGLAVLALLFLFVHYQFFHTFIENPQFFANQRQTTSPPPEQIFRMFRMFKWFYVIFGLWFSLSALLNILSGIFLRSRTHRDVSIVIAAIDCIHIPFGTMLGVFTIVVLMRDSVRELYAT